MKNTNRYLFCCDSREELAHLIDICKSDYMIATSEYSFFKEVREQEKSVVFLESDESNPYETIWEILDQIHNVVDDGRTVDKFLRLFHLSYHVEGGFPTKIAQMIINLNLISKIVHDNEIQEIYLYDNVHNWIINESIFLYSKSHDINCHVLDLTSREEKSCLKTLVDMERETAGFSDENLIREESEKMRCLSEASEKKCKKEAVYEKEDVGILYCPNFLYRKHVDWVMRRIDAIGHDVKVICFYDTEAVSEFRQKGLKADCMEEYFEKEEFINAYEKLKLERTEILKRLARQLKVSYRETDLSRWLLIKVRNHYYRELLNYLYMEVCASNYFKQREFTFIHAWGNSEFWQTWVCYDNTRDSNSILFKIDGLNFITPQNRVHFPEMIPVMFAANKEELFVTDYPRKDFSICDPFWGKRSALGRNALTGGKKNRIGIFPTGVLKGFTTYRFYYGTWMPLVDLLLNSGYKIVFKNHPALRECWEEDMEAKYRDNEHVTILASNETIDKALECCDMVITDISSVVLDAALAQKAVFCIVDERGYDMIGHHASGFSIYQSTEELLKEIVGVSQNDKMYQAVLEKQNAYMEKITGNTNSNNRESVYILLQGLK